MRPGTAPEFRLRAIIGLLAVMTSACTAHHGAARNRSELSTEAGAFIFEYADVDGEARANIEQAIRAASPRLAEWGGLEEPVNVFIMPTHDALEDAVDRNGYDWLRAWARYDEIYLQSPRTWTVFGANQSDLNELMLHELTHSVMYQQSADRTHWARKGIPLWFREGMASFTANQGYRWPSLEDLARFYSRNPDRDPVGDPEPLYQYQSGLVYGAAHHAFTFLVRRYSADRVRAVLAEMRRGSNFKEAFTQAIGVPQDAFVEDFRRYVRLRGFSQGRIRRTAPFAPPRKLEKPATTAPPASQPKGAPEAPGSQDAPGPAAPE